MHGGQAIGKRNKGERILEFAFANDRPPSETYKTYKNL